MQIVTADLKDKNPGMIINFVLDKSSSMATRAQSTIEGVNEYIATQQNSREAQRQGQVFLTMTLFDTNFDILYACKPINEVPKLDNRSYCPNGMTALNDAIAFTIQAVAKEIDGWEKKPAILTVVMTDGGENSSKEYSNHTGGTTRVKELIQQKEREGNWTFVFLADTLTAERDGQALGIRSSKQYDANNAKGTMRAFACSTVCYADSLESTGKLSVNNFFEGTESFYDRAAQGDSLTDVKQTGGEVPPHK